MKANPGFKTLFSKAAVLLSVSCILVISAACRSEPAADSRTFSDPAKGFAITRPAGWRFATREEIVGMRAGASFKDKEFETLVREKALLPFVVIIKHETTYEGLNPSVQVTLRPLGELESLPVIFIMNMILPSFEKALPDFERVENVRLDTVAGREAAFAKSQYNYRSEDGRTFAVLNRMWFLRRGKDLLMISMTDPQEGPDVSEAEFAEILKSIKIEE